MSEGRRESWPMRLALYGLLLVGVTPVLLPFYWMVLSSLQTRAGLSAQHTAWTPRVERDFAPIDGHDVRVVIIDDGRQRGAAESRVRRYDGVGGIVTVPAGLVRHESRLAPQWTNYSRAWQDQTFGLFIVNTIFIAALVVLGTVLSCGLVGFAFARLEFRGRNALFLLLLATLMIPGQVTSIPTFVLFAKLGWIDSYKPLIVPSFLAASAFFVFLFRQFMLSIPRDVEDAARVDGCGPVSIWWLIMMPMSRPIIVTVAVFAFVGVWNDFLNPLLYINSNESQTVALGLQNFKAAFQGDDPQVLMAASVMMMFPTLLLFFIAQKAFVRGVVVTGVKG